MAPSEVFAAYREQAANPAFEEVARLERTILERAEPREFWVDGLVWFRKMTGKIERLREVESLQSEAILRRAVENGSQG